MHAQQLMELAAELATQCTAFLHGSSELKNCGIEQYWVASRCRLDRWSTMLRRYTDLIQIRGANDATALWQLVRPTLEEILVSEVLARIWTAIVAADDKRRGTRELEPVARSILVGHAEARHRTLKLMINGQGFGVEQAVTLNRLRRRCERWNDTLLAAVGKEAEVEEFAFDARHVREATADLRDACRRGKGRLAWQVVLASLRVSFHRGSPVPAANPDLNERIAMGIMSCLAADAFDGRGVLKSSWLMRISSITAETQTMIDNLFSDELDSSSHEPSKSGVASDQSRRF